MPRKVDLDAMYVEEALELTTGGKTYTVEKLSAKSVMGLQQAVANRESVQAIDAMLDILGSLGLGREEILTWDFRTVLGAAGAIVEHFTSLQPASVPTPQSAEVAEVDGSIVN